MTKALAHDLQVKALGGLSKRSRQALMKAARADNLSALVSSASRGSRFLREWHGEIHEVEVLEEGYLYRGTPYRSLSAIARRITGARWSGPRFFRKRERS